MDTQEAFGIRLRELRKRANLTQNELANRVGHGFVMQRIGELERGESNCTLQTIERLADGLRCEPAELFLFGPHSLNQPISILDPRIIEIWENADYEAKRRILRVVSELV